MQLIIDEFTHLPVSRQRKHQLRKQKQGLCMICAAPAVNAFFCPAHLETVRTYQRTKYREEHQLPPDTPISSVGRPRKY